MSFYDHKEIDPELYNYNKFPGPVFHQVGDQIRSENLSFELLKNESGTEIGNSLEFDFVVPPPHS